MTTSRCGETADEWNESDVSSLSPRWTNRIDVMQHRIRLNGAEYLMSMEDSGRKQSRNREYFELPLILWVGIHFGVLFLCPWCLYTAFCTSFGWSEKPSIEYPLDYNTFAVLRSIVGVWFISITIYYSTWAKWECVFSLLCWVSLLTYYDKSSQWMWLILIPLKCKWSCNKRWIG